MQLNKAKSMRSVMQSISHDFGAALKPLVAFLFCESKRIAQGIDSCFGCEHLHVLMTSFKSRKGCVAGRQIA